MKNDECPPYEVSQRQSKKQRRVSALFKQKRLLAILVKIRGFASRTRVFSSRVNEDENEISRIPLPRQNKLDVLKSRDLAFRLEISKPRVFFGN